MKKLLKALMAAALVALVCSVVAALTVVLINHRQGAIPGSDYRQESAIDAGVTVAAVTFVLALAGRLIFGAEFMPLRFPMALLLGWVPFFVGMNISEGDIEYTLYQVAVMSPVFFVLGWAITAPMIHWVNGYKSDG